MQDLHGSCLCQSVKYRLSGEIRGFYLCHCSRCRKVTGSAHAANLFVKLDSFTWLGGEELVSRYQVEGTRFAKAFCSRCSAALPNFRPEGAALIPAGSLDSELPTKPLAHIFCDSRASWDDGFAHVPQLPGLPR